MGTVSLVSIESSFLVLLKFLYLYWFFYIAIFVTKKRYVKKNSHYDGEFDYSSFNSVNFFNIYFEDQLLTAYKSRSIVSSQ